MNVFSRLWRVVWVLFCISILLSEIDGFTTKPSFKSLRCCPHASWFSYQTSNYQITKTLYSSNGAVPMIIYRMAKLKSAESPQCNTSKESKASKFWSGEILSYLLSHYSDILYMIIELCRAEEFNFHFILKHFRSWWWRSLINLIWTLHPSAMKKKLYWTELVCLKTFH